MAGYIGARGGVTAPSSPKKIKHTATAGQTAFSTYSYVVGNVDVYRNGVRLVDGTDFTATDGSTVTLTVGADLNDELVIKTLDGFSVADAVPLTGGTMTGNLQTNGTLTVDGTSTLTGAVTTSAGIIMPAGQGIDFSASEGSGATSSVLDDYEEGTWTPTLATGTATALKATYTKIGNRVTLNAQLNSFSDITTAATLIINGAPFALAQDQTVGSAMWSNSGGVLAGTVYFSTTDGIRFYEAGSTGSFQLLQHADLTSGAAVYFQATYRTLA